MDPANVCSQIQNISKIAQECCPKSNGLKHLAEKHWISMLAYFCAFLPWGIIYALDFIADRWRTISETRKEGIFHIVFTLLPLSYVLFYAYLQAVAENFHEMAAALIAVVLCLLHVLRTIWGLMQLSVFADWTFRALRCLSNMGYTIEVHEFGDDDGFEDLDQRGMDTERDRGRRNSQMHDFGEDDGFEDLNQRGMDTERDRGHPNSQVYDFGEDDSFEGLNQHGMNTELDRGRPTSHKRRFCSERTLRRTVEHRMVVNHTIIDNAFHEAKLPVKFRKRAKVGKTTVALNTSWGRRFSDFVKCTKPEECAIQWAVAFLSQFGAPWLKECKPEDVDIPLFRTRFNGAFLDRKKQCITFYRNLSLFAFLHVTNRNPFSREGSGVEAGDGEWQIHSPVAPGFDIRGEKERQSTLRHKEISRSCFPYKWAPRKDFALKRFRHTVAEAKNSWHALALNALNDEEHSAVDAISARQIAAFFYIFDKKPVVREYLISRMPSMRPSSQAETSFMKQLALNRESSFCQLKNDVPIPNASYYVPLWSDSGHVANRLLLQASVHIDNWLSLLAGATIVENRKRGRLEQLESTEDDSVFEVQKCLELDRLRFLPDHIDQPENLSADEDYIGSPRFLGCIMETVRSKIAEWVFNNEGCNNWTSNLERSVEFSISPQLENILRTKVVHNESVWMRLLWEAQSHMDFALNTDACSPSRTGEEPMFRTPPHSMEEAAFLCVLGFPSISVERESASLYTICPRGAPQGIRLSLSIVQEARGKKVKMFAINADGTSGKVPFHWQQWRDAFFGRVYAQSEWRNMKGLAAVDVDILCSSELPMSQGIRRYNVQQTDTGPNWEVPLWDGWRPHYPQSAFFEVFQAVTKTGLDYDSSTDADLATVIAAVATAVSGESRISQLDHSWISDCRSVVEIHEKAIEEIDESNSSKALKGFSYCVKEFGHEPSLRHIFNIVFRNESLDDEEVDLLFASMGSGAKLLESQTIGRIQRPYERFFFVHLGYIFAKIYAKTKITSALEYSMVSVPIDSSEVDALKEELENGNKRAHLFLAIYFLRSFKSTKYETEKKNAISHLSQWGRSLGSIEACLSIGFLLEKRSFRGRDAHKLYPLLRQFANEPMAEAILMAHFLPWVSFADVSEALHSYPRPEHLKDSIEIGLQNVIVMEPDKSSAIDMYRYTYDQTRSGSRETEAAYANAKSLALNRQGLMQLGENPGEALHMFQTAASIEHTDESLNQMLACNNAGAVFQMQSNFSMACEEFKKVVKSREELEGKTNWENCAEGSLGRRKRFSAKTFSPAMTGANNLAVTKEQMSEKLSLAEIAEVKRLYEEAAKQGHPVAMYNYAVYLMSEPQRDISKAGKLLSRVLAMGDELFPMHNLISQALFLGDYFRFPIVGEVAWKSQLDEIDGCLAAVKCLEYDSVSSSTNYSVSSSTNYSVSSSTNFVPGTDENV